MAEKRESFTPPYLSWRTFFNFLDRLAEKGAPDRIDRTFLSNMSGADQSYLLKALQGFGLMAADGRKTQALDTLVHHESRKAAVQTLLETHYPTMIALPANATQGQLDEAFKPYGLGVETVRKCQTFYLRAAQYAGISLSSNFKAPATGPGESAPRAPRRPRSPKRKGSSGSGEDQSTPPPPPPPAEDTTYPKLQIHPMLHGPLVWLSQNGPKWSQEQSEAWLASFTTQVLLVYPPKRPAMAPVGPRTAKGEETPEAH